MKDILICFSVIIGTIIGAGFASGREILSFFNIYPNKGLLGIIISSILFGIIIEVVITLINKKNINKYEELIENNKTIVVILKIFSLICFCIMIAGVGTFVEEQLSINFWIGVAFAVSLSYCIFLHRFDALEIFNCLLVPFIIIGIIIIGISKCSDINITYNKTLEKVVRK